MEVNRGLNTVLRQVVIEKKEPVVSKPPTTRMSIP